jgi:hypothetical protein
MRFGCAGIRGSIWGAMNRSRDSNGGSRTASAPPQGGGEERQAEI